MDVISPFIVVCCGLSCPISKLTIVILVYVGGGIQIDGMHGNQLPRFAGDEIGFDVIGS